MLVVTGTSTGVGKTVATAALAVRAGDPVTVVKPVQTGVGDGSPGDAEVVQRADRLCRGGVDPARRTPRPRHGGSPAGVPIPRVAEHAERVRALADDRETVIVEGAGGLLVRLDTDGGTLLDLASELAGSVDVQVVVVVAAGLGTLNHTELTVGALRARGLEPSGLVVGSWPAEPDLAERCNLEDLPRVTGVPLLAVIPEGAGSLPTEAFRAAAPTWFRNLPDPQRKTPLPETISGVPKLLRGVIAALAVIAVLAPAAAHAERWAGGDPRGDVEGWHFDPEPEPCGTDTQIDATQNTNSDITRLVVRHTRTAVQLTCASATSTPRSSRSPCSTSRPAPAGDGSSTSTASRAGPATSA